ncbi:hypothetical protein [Deinococcus hohokamensis]|uniref:Uncharacterized protein n=1 Tax=Deinococcus hohokamensis TaxID=309883 RepID=A0ABV9I6F6_9DEIO
MTTFHSAPRFRPVLAHPAAPPRHDERLFGTWVMEVLTPGGRLDTPALTGWEMRSWPVARLGDLTLEVRALQPGLNEHDLQAVLTRSGYTVLGPVRRRSAPGPEVSGQRAADERPHQG